MAMSFVEAKKKTDNKIKKNREKYFGTKKSGIPETTQSKKRLGTTIKNLVSPAKSSEPKTFGAAFKAARRENRLEELGRVDAEKAYTKKGKRNLRDEKSRIRGELKGGGIAKRGMGKAFRGGGLV